MKTKPNDTVTAKFIRVDGSEQSFGGLTKREYFAAMALQGLSSYAFSTNFSEAASLAVQHADALIKELNKER